LSSLAEALVNAHKRGVNVQAILDKSQRTEQYSPATFLIHAGIPTYIDDKHAIAHNKVMVIDSHTVISVQFVAGQYDAPQVRRQLQAYFPEATFQPKTDNLQQAWESCPGEEMLAIEFGLAREFMLPLASGKLDPFIGMVGALSELSPGDLGLFQILFQPAQEDWPESIMRSVTHADGKPFFVNSPELAGAAGNKISKPLYAAVVRIATKGKTHARALQTACDMAGSLRVFSDSGFLKHARRTRQFSGSSISALVNSYFF
jgi:hypothetical protein